MKEQLAGGSVKSVVLDHLSISINRVDIEKH